ncbi:MAG TPA: hypothetical protein VF297_31345 [Pyrinomonadaceae bacterium]
MRDERHEQRVREEPPPFGGSWRRLYAVVLLTLVVLVTLFDIFTRYFR